MRRKGKIVPVIGNVLRWQLACLGIFLSGLSAGSCSKDHDGHYQPLPDDPSYKISGIALKKALFEGARRGLDGLSRLGKSMPPGYAIFEGQCQVARLALEDREQFLDLEPLVLRAFTYEGADSKTYLAVTYVNANRETHRLKLILRGPNNELIHIVYRRELKVKELEYINTWVESVASQKWEELLTHTTSDPEGPTIYVTPGNDIPFAKDDGIFACIAIEDRSGKMSSFVPVVHLDWVFSTANEQPGTWFQGAIAIVCSVTCPNSIGAPHRPTGTAAAMSARD